MRRFTCILFTFVAGVGSAPPVIRADVVTLPSSHEAELRRTLDAFVRAPDEPAGAFESIITVGVSGPADLGLLYRKMSEYLAAPDLTEAMAERVERLARLGTLVRGAPVEVPAAKRAALVRDAAALLAHYENRNTPRELIAWRMNLFDLWDERSLWSLEADVDRLDEPRVFDSVARAALAFGPEARARLLAAVRAGAASPKTKVSLLDEAHALTFDDERRALALAANEFAAAVDGRRRSKVTRPLKDERFAEWLNSVRARLDRMEPDAWTLLGRARAAVASPMAVRFFAIFPSPHFDWLDRGRWMQLARGAAPRPRPAGPAGTIRLIDPALCGSKITGK